jgi:FkbH-like protein
MWQTDWAEGIGQSEIVGTPEASTLSSARVAATYLLFWVEHCIECAIPECYKVCPLYVARRDRKCARFKNGISPNPKYPGLLPYGAEVEFRRWGKIEANFGFGSVLPDRVRLLDRMDRSFLRRLRTVSSIFRGLSPNLRLNGAYAVFRERLLQRLTQRPKEVFDEFVIEVWNLQAQPVRLVIECWQQGPRFRTSILLEPGRTIQRIPASSMNVDLYGEFGMIRVYPENDAEAHVVFSWLDFVKYSQSPKGGPHQGPEAAAQAVQAASKVKCVIWDLDKTAWDGILGEQDPDAVSLRPEVLQTMLALDERGILQSIASKNDHDNAWQVLECLGITHLFLYPQINWEPKSVNIARIVSALNIGIDSCAFVDDSAFERAEVMHELPGIHVFADSEVSKLLSRPEFNVPVTAESKQRRNFYVSESQRKEKALEFGDRYEAFLRTCKMEATLFRPTEPEHVERCLELLHRSNQLNLSTHRYTRDEFEGLLRQSDVLCICTACRDRFGDYGIVGFASVGMLREGAWLKDYVLSCRVAQKKVENAWFGWLCRSASAAGYSQIRAPYVKTARNGVLRNALLEVGFLETEKHSAGSMLVLDCKATPPASDIVSIAASSLELRSGALPTVEPREHCADGIEETRPAAS